MHIAAAACFPQSSFSPTVSLPCRQESRAANRMLKRILWVCVVVVILNAIPADSALAAWAWLSTCCLKRFGA